MGSVIDQTTCVCCGWKEAMQETHYKINEEDNFCSRCGTKWGVGMYNDEFGRPRRGYHKIKRRHCAKWGRHGRAMTLFGMKHQDIEDFKRQYNKHKKSIDVAEYTFFKKGEWFIRDLVKNNVRRFED